MAVDFLRYLIFGDFEPVMLLHVHPELGAVFEVAAKPQGAIRGDAAALIHDLGDARDWDMKVHRQFVHAEAQGLHEFFAQHFPGMDGFCFFAMLFFISNFEISTAGGRRIRRGLKSLCENSS